MSGSTCRSCNAPITWARIKQGGRRMPLNPEADWDRGNVRLIGPNLEGEEVGVVLSHDEARDRRKDGERLYLSHFATCPSARLHRRR